MVLQILCLGLTTNEKLNYSRYKYLKDENSKEKKSIFDKGLCYNLLSFLNLCNCGTVYKKVDWYETYLPFTKPIVMSSAYNAYDKGPAMGTDLRNFDQSYNLSNSNTSQLSNPFYQPIHSYSHV